MSPPKELEIFPLGSKRANNGKISKELALREPSFKRLKAQFKPPRKKVPKKNSGFWEVILIPQNKPKKEFVIQGILNLKIPLKPGLKINQ